MEKENVLEIEFIPIWDNNFVWKIIKQNEDVLKIGEFEDSDLSIVSCSSVDYDKKWNVLYLKGKITEDDYNLGRYNFCTLEEKKLIEKKVKAINEKYGIKKHWRADKHDLYYFLNSLFEIQETVETRNIVDIERYQKGNYFRKKEEAEEYLEYIKKSILEWHEKRDNDE